MLTKGGDFILVSAMIDHLDDGDADQTGQDQDGERDDNNDRRIPDQFVPKLVMGSQLSHDRAEEHPGEETLSTGTHPTLKKAKTICLAKV